MLRWIRGAFSVALSFCCSLFHLSQKSLLLAYLPQEKLFLSFFRGRANPPQGQEQPFSRVDTRAIDNSQIRIRPPPRPEMEFSKRELLGRGGVSKKFESATTIKIFILKKYFRVIKRGLLALRGEFLASSHQGISNNNQDFDFENKLYAQGCIWVDL